MMDPPHGGAELGGGAGEVRRINVVYFLSRGGRTDHPHLFRVNHHSRAGGVRLGDVKRWLSEIRGKGMPANFSWSYKRKYKSGYVWQDLKDDDLITPVSDNEYVLKGCDVRGTPPRSCVQAPKTPPSLLEDEKETDEKSTRCGDRQNPVDRPVDEVELSPDDSDEGSSPKPPVDQDSPPGSGGSSARRHSTVLFKVEVSQDLVCRGDQSQRRRQEEPALKAVAGRAVAPEGEQLQRAGGKARGMRVARALHSIMTCGAADADDTALRTVARRQRRSAAEAGGDGNPTPTCPGMDGCGLSVSRKARSRRGGKEQQQGKRDGGKRDGGNAYKPAALPHCSQCGKEFKPHELHSHMQSCRGFKERMRNNGSPRVSVDRNRSYSTAKTAEYRRTKHGHRSREQPSSASASAVFLLTES